jgi:hypothetical protein
VPLHVTITSDREEGACAVCAESTYLTRLLVEVPGHTPVYTDPFCSWCLVDSGKPIVMHLYVDENEVGTKRSPKLRKSSMRQERQIAEMIGGRTQPASGALASAKGDVRKRGVLRGELKQTSAKSFSLKRDDLDKIRSECVGREKPFFSIRFTHPVTLTTEDEWVCIPIEDWVENAPTDDRRPTQCRRRTK